MNNNERFMAAADEQDPQTDPLNPAIAAALADRALPPVPDATHAEAAAGVLTQADQQALASLGSSRDLVRNVIASVTPTEPAVAKAVSEDATLSADGDMTIPLPGSPFWPSGASPDLDALAVRLDAVQKAGQISWTSCYRKLEELGRGGQGVVYLTECLDELSGEQALKIYSSQPYRSAAAYHEDMQRVLKVASLVHRIHHDNLIDVQRFVEYKGIYVMVMQWIDGFDLRRLLDPQLVDRLRQHVDPERWTYLDNVIYATPAAGRLCLQPLLAVNIVEKCLRGLGALHEKGVVHGDIKPSNIMLDCNGSIRLVDIGSACPFNAPPRQRTWTPRYAPPEFFERGEWTPQSDLASLGYVLIELLSGQPDMAGPNVGDQSTRTADRRRDVALLEAKRHLTQQLPELLPENVCRSKALMRLCLKLIDPDPKNRFANAKQAILGNGDGTWHFRKQLIRGDLAVHECSEIQTWVENIKSLTR